MEIVLLSTLFYSALIVNNKPSFLENPEHGTRELKKYKLTEYIGIWDFSMEKRLAREERTLLLQQNLIMRLILIILLILRSSIRYINCLRVCMWLIGALLQKLHYY